MTQLKQAHISKNGHRDGGGTFEEAASRSIAFKTEAYLKRSCVCLPNMLHKLLEYWQRHGQESVAPRKALFARALTHPKRNREPRACAVEVSGALLIASNAPVTSVYKGCLLIVGTTTWNPQAAVSTTASSSKHCSSYVL